MLKMKVLSFGWAKGRGVVENKTAVWLKQVNESKENEKLGQKSDNEYKDKMEGLSKYAIFTMSENAY